MKIFFKIFSILVLIFCVKSQRVVYECNFDSASSIEGCGGIFNYAVNGQQAGVLQYLDGFNSDLKYDLTDLSSTRYLASNGLPCNMPFYYNSRYNNFCVKMSGNYKCQTANSYGDCYLGRFFGIKTTSPSSKFQMSFETTYPISLNSGRFYNLQFNIFYNCYQTKSVLDFFKSDCSDVVDRLTIYYKPTPNDLYSPLRQFNLTKRDNSDNWRQFNLDIYSITNILSIKIGFERISGGSKGEAIFGLDNLSLIDNLISSQALSGSSTASSSAKTTTLPKTTVSTTTLPTTTLPKTTVSTTTLPTTTLPKTTVSTTTLPTTTLPKTTSPATTLPASTILK